MEQMKDFVTDNNPTVIYKLGDLNALPEYVKQASVITKEDTKNLPDDFFADKVNRLYPIHTKSAAFLSAMYMADTDSVDIPEYATRRVQDACSAHRITDDVDAAITKMADLSKAASAVEEENEAQEEDESYALIYKNASNEDCAAYNTSTWGNVVSSAAAVLKDYEEENIPTLWFKSACENIVKAAREKEVGLQHLPDAVLYYGTERAIDEAKVARAIKQRVDAGISKEAADLYSNVSKLTEEITSGPAVDKFIELWQDLDAANGITKYSSCRIMSPLEAFCSGTPMADLFKEAASNVIFDKDVIIPIEVITNIPEETVTTYLRKEAADCVSGLIDLCKQANGIEASHAVCHLAPSRRREILDFLVQHG